MRLQFDGLAERHNWIERDAGCARQPAALGAQGRWRARRLAAPQESRPVGFIRAGERVSWRDRRRMRQIDEFFARRPGSPSKEERARFWHVLAFDKQLVEGRMARVSGLRRQDDFAIAGYCDAPDALAVIGERDAANLHVVFWRDRDGHRQADAVIVAPKFCHVWIELHGLALRRRVRRLIGSRPHIAGLHVLKIDPGAAVLACRVSAPPREVEVLPATKSSPRARNQHAVLSIRQEMNLGRGRLRRHTPRRSVDLLPTRVLAGGARVFRLYRFDGRIIRHFFLQEQFDTPHDWVGVETPHHHVVAQVVDEREQYHSLVMRHV